MDEMDREIQLRSMERGYKAAIVSLCLWVLYNSYQTHLHTAQSISRCPPSFYVWQYVSNPSHKSR